MTPKHVPAVTFHTRVRNDALAGPNPYEWQDVTTDDLFAGQNVVLFGVPGAFTPACSESHLPGYEAAFDAFTALGIDRVLCLSVNDAFVMRHWAQAQGIEKVTMLPDGNGTFSEKMGLLVARSAQGMGRRSWRYALHAVDGVIEKLFVEPGLQDNPPGVPVDVSGAETMLTYLRNRAG